MTCSAEIDASSFLGKINWNRSPRYDPKKKIFLTLVVLSATLLAGVVLIINPEWGNLNENAPVIAGKGSDIYSRKEYQQLTNEEEFVAWFGFVEVLEVFCGYGKGNVNHGYN